MLVHFGSVILIVLIVALRFLCVLDQNKPNSNLEKLADAATISSTSCLLQRNIEKTKFFEKHTDSYLQYVVLKMFFFCLQHTIADIVESIFTFLYKPSCRTNKKVISCVLRRVMVPKIRTQHFPVDSLLLMRIATPCWKFEFVARQAVGGSLYLRHTIWLKWETADASVRVDANLYRLSIT